MFARLTPVTGYHAALLKTLPGRFWKFILQAKRMGAALVGVMFVALLLFIIVAIPRYQVRDVTVEGPDRSAKTAALINENRRTLVQFIAGVLAVAVTVYVAARQIAVTRDQNAVAREGQITDRFTRAIAQLGDDKLSVRIGGIFVLERMARESTQDQWTIVETLAAFIRENTSVPTAKNVK